MLEKIIVKGADHMNGSSGSVQSVARVLDITEALSTAPQGMSLSDLAATTGLHISTTHRLLGVLVERGYACKDQESGKYRADTPLV